MNANAEVQDNESSLLREDRDGIATLTGHMGGVNALAADVTTVLDVRTDPWQVHYRAPEFAEFHKF